MSGKEKNRMAMFILLTAVTGVLIWMIRLSTSDMVENQVLINEVCSSNFSLVMNENGRYPDYVELYNPGNETVSLEGCFLSDDENRLWKKALGSVSIPPKGYYVVWLDGSDGAAGEGEDFGIARTGEQIFLSRMDTQDGEDNTQGKEIILDSVRTPQLSFNTSYGRIGDGKKNWQEMSGTAGYSNDNAILLPARELETPVFSAESGFYDKEFELEIQAGTDEVVCYTLDGSDPTPDSAIYQGSLLIGDTCSQENLYSARTDLSPTRDYTPSFPVDKATVVRAISYRKKDNMVSDIATKVYFVGYGQKEEYEGMPVVSIVTDPDHLFDAKSGIYCNGDALEKYKEEAGAATGEVPETFVDDEGETHYLYMASNAFHEGREWEREAVMTWFDDAHRCCFTKGVGIRIAGDSTRASPKKSISVYGREIYDESAVFPIEFFPGMSYSSVKLRNGGDEDVVIRDAFLEKLAAGRNVSIQDSRPCVLFLNGEYWGIYNLRERYNEEYLGNHYGVSEGNVYLINAGLVRAGGEAAFDAYNYMCDVVTECDLSYDDVYEMVCEIIDVQSLIDYCCINLYIDNQDISLGHNTALWRAGEKQDPAYGDGRWRWMVFDLDIAAQPNENVTSGWMKESVLWNEPIIQSLLDNQTFRRQFCVTFMDIANGNYNYDIVRHELEKWKEKYSAQAVKTQHRFFTMDFTKEDYADNLAEIDTFFMNRFPAAMAGLAEAFDLKGSLEPVSVKILAPEGGTVTVNSVTVKDCEEWEGQYFTDFPVTLTAIPKEGYRFAGWTGTVTGNEEQLTVNIPEGGIAISAVFEKIP